MSGPSRTFTRIGMPLYWAPEYLSSTGYGFESDLWALGICIYMLLFGVFPFGEEDDDPYTLGQKITNDSHEYPEKFVCEENQEVIDFVDQMLHKNPSSRFNGSYDALKTHAWLKGFDFVSLAV